MDYRYDYLPGTEGEAQTQYIKTNGGFLHRVIVGTTSAKAVQIWDGTDGGANNVQIGELKASISEGSYEFNCLFANGLYIGNPGGSKLTIIYR